MQNSREIKNSAVTIGVFDGVHRGHAQLVQKTVQIARENSLVAIAVTFDEHPETVLHAQSFRVLTTKEEKEYLLKKAGADFVISMPFTKAISELMPQDFMQILYASVNLRELIIGHDFALGAGRRGNYPALKEIGLEMGYNVTQVEPLMIGGHTVSSTFIRRALAENNLEKAEELLGHPYLVMGEVVEGVKRGREIGFPTANVFISIHKLLPQGGVYAARATVDGAIYEAVLNIGSRPTFTEPERTFEVHLLDFSGNLYGKTLKTDIISFIRPEERFESAGALSKQIKQDVARARQILKDKTYDTN